MHAVDSYLLLISVIFLCMLTAQRFVVNCHPIEPPNKAFCGTSDDNKKLQKGYKNNKLLNYCLIIIDL